MSAHLKDIAGHRNGMLVAKWYEPSLKKWRCFCDCGVPAFVSGSNFKKTKSCGCQKNSGTIRRNTRHGDSTRGAVAPEYRIYRSMLRRCLDPKNSAYPHYGSRGIFVCDRWINGEDGLSGYECFLADMMRRPTPEHSIDRIDNDGGYEPGNVRWATRKTQMRNRRGRHVVTYHGERMPLSEAAERAGLPRKIVEGRLKKGWSDNEALSTPLLPKFGGIGPERFARRSK